MHECEQERSMKGLVCVCVCVCVCAEFFSWFSGCPFVCVCVCARTEATCESQMHLPEVSGPLSPRVLRWRGGGDGW